MIGLEQVSLAFGEKQVLERCSFSLPEWGVTGLSAPSGMGKTTLLRLMAGLLPPDTGRVHHPQQVTILFQENRLLPWRTVSQHISDVLPHPRRTEVSHWLRLVELEEEAKSYPNSLSGGMGRRLSLARTLALGGDLILLDEPFTGVDAPRTEKLMQYLCARPVPVLIASHESSVLAQCHRVFSLEDSHITQISSEIEG